MIETSAVAGCTVTHDHATNGQRNFWSLNHEGKDPAFLRVVLLRSEGVN